MKSSPFVVGLQVTWIKERLSSSWTLVMSVLTTSRVLTREFHSSAVLTALVEPAEPPALACDAGRSFCNWSISA